MNNNLLRTGIFSGAMIIALILFDIISRLTYGGGLLDYPFNPNWFVAVVIFHIIDYLVLLNYFHSKGYSVARTVGWVAFLILLCFYFFTFQQILGISSIWYDITGFLALGAGLLFNLGIIFSKASERILLKRAGQWSFVITLALLLISIMVRTTSNEEMLVTLSEWYLWLSVLSTLTIIYYILNFYRELKSGQKLTIA